MIKVAALTSGKSVPSSRFRVRQHIDKLKTYDIYVKEYCPAISKYQAMPFFPNSGHTGVALPFHIIWKFIKLSTRIPGVIGSYSSDIVWLERELSSNFPTLEILLKQPLIFDVDDAIWMSKPYGEKTASNIAKLSSCIIAGNEYIADWFSNYSDNVVVIPTAVDTERYYPEKHHDFKDLFVIGWIGTSSNLKYLESIESAIKRFMKESTNCRLLVVCDKKPVFPNLDERYVIYTPWSKENEIRMIQNMDIGLMPLENSEWVRGKCSFKMLQYMSCGKPVVVSPVGMNIEVMRKGGSGIFASTNGDWYQALMELYRNDNDRIEKGLQGRKVILENYSSSIVSKMISTAITKTV